MDGTELCEKIREFDNNAKIYFMTGSVLFTEEEARKRGALGLIKKPFKPDDLLDKLK